MKRIIRAAKASVAPAVVAVALLAACGGDDPGQATSQAARRQVDSLAPSEAQAEKVERLAHLQGQARTYGAPTQRRDIGHTDPDAARNWALAESLERSAKLEGQARTHSKPNSADDASAPADEMSDDEFVPGSRHMPVR